MHPDQQLRERGFAAHEAGDLEGALRVYREVLHNCPDDLEVMHACGIAEVQCGRYAAAEELLAPVVRGLGSAAAHGDLGNALLGMGRAVDALDRYDHALALDPTLAGGWINRAHALRSLGRRQEALESFARASALNPRIIDAHRSRASVLLELGRWSEALESATTALSMGGDCAEVHTQCGVALAQLGRSDEARQRYEFALTRDAGYVPALVNRGILLRNLNLQQDALRDYARALEVDPQSFEALSNRALALIELERFDAALEDCARAAALRAQWPELHLQRGAALSGLARHADALDAYEAALAGGADPARAHQGRAGALLELGRSREAAVGYATAIRLQPSAAKSHLGLGRALSSLERFEDAVASFDRALALDANCRDAYVGRAAARRRLNLMEEALADCDRAIALKADAGAYCNRGSVLTELNRCSAALESFDRALALDAQHAAAHFNRSIALLLSGQIDMAWADYEWRWDLKQEDGAVARRDYAVPRWTGDQSIAGKSLLVYCEQGLGDTLQFARYATPLAALGARVVLEVQPPLVALIASVQGAGAVLAQGESLPSCDYCCPLMSVPLACKTSLETIPAPARYVHSEPTRVARWNVALGERVRPRIGLVWSGSARHKHDHNRSLPFASLIERLPQGFGYVSLQKDPRDADRRALAAHPEVFDAAPELRDFRDTAALCDCLDLIISVDTSVAHLGGALGRPTWILLPWYPDWRWQLDRDDSPWYASVRLYRQATPGDWPGVIERVAADLERHFAVYGTRNADGASPRSWRPHTVT